jgi:hypothetical protein
MTEDASGLDAAKRLRSVAGALGEAEPKHIHRRAEILHFEPGEGADRGMSAIGTDDQIGADIEHAVREFRSEPCNSIAVPYQSVGLGLHHQLEARIAFALVGKKLKKVPLREEGDEAAAGGKVGKIGQDDFLITDDPTSLAHLLVRQLEKRIQQAKLVHDLERRGMDRVTAEITQEIRVLFQHHDVDAGAGEQVAEHHAGRTTARDGASRGNLLARHVLFYLAAVPSFRRKPESIEKFKSEFCWIPAFAGMTSK